MKEYIERGELEEEFNSRLKDLTNEYGRHDYYVMGFEEAVNKIDYIHNAADVKEVVHAKWDDNGRCTNCGGHAPYYSMASTYYASPYCFECGAMMDKEE